MVETKVDRAMALIKKLGQARSDQIADHLGIPIGNVVPLLQDRLRSGALVSCKVERPGKPAVSEFRLSAAGPTGKRPTDYGKALAPAAPPRPAKATTAVAESKPEVAAVGDVNITVTSTANAIDHATASEIAKHIKAPAHGGLSPTMAAVDESASQKNPAIVWVNMEPSRFRISDDAELTVEYGPTVALRLDKKDTVRLFNFLRGFLPEFEEV